MSTPEEIRQAAEDAVRSVREPNDVGEVHADPVLRALSYLVPIPSGFFAPPEEVDAAEDQQDALLPAVEAAVRATGYEDESITDEQIAALRAEGVADDDETAVAVCDAALGHSSAVGRRVHRQECARIIRYAVAMSRPTMDGPAAGG